MRIRSKLDKALEKLNDISAPEGVRYYWSGGKAHCYLWRSTIPGESSMVFHAPYSKALDLIDEECHDFICRGLKGQKVRIKPGYNISLDERGLRDKLTARTEGIVIRDLKTKLDVDFSGIVIKGIQKEAFQVQKWEDLEPNIFFEAEEKMKTAGDVIDDLLEKARNK